MRATKHTLSVASAVALTVTAAIGCGGSQQTSAPVERAEPAPRGPVSQSGSERAEASIGSSGGVLSLDNGARLAVPEGALDQDVDVVLELGADGRAFGDAETQRPLGPILNIEPSLNSQGPSFEVSVVSMPIPDGFSTDDLAFAIEEVDDQQRAIDTLGVQTRWQFYHASADGGRFVAQVSRLYGHRVQFGVAR